MMIRSVLVLGLVGAGAWGCSSDATTTPGTTAGDGGTSGDSGGSSGTPKFEGQIIGYSSATGVSGISVEAGSVKATTDTKGGYVLNVAKDSAFNLVVSDPAGKFFTLVDQEMKISGDYDHGRLRFVDKGVGDILLSTLKADAAKGVVSFAMKDLGGACSAKAADFPQGAKIEVEGQPDAKVVYYKGTPNPTLTEAQGGEDPAAVVFNATPDAPLTIKMTYSKCTQKAFPVSEGAVTYTGKLQPKGNSTLSVYRAFFE